MLIRLLLCLLPGLGVVADAQDARGPSCASASECEGMAREAIEREAFEDAHSLAWRAVQTGPRNDPRLMQLLARTQSLSGRPRDALVMLRRLVQMGVRTDEAETSDDFQRVRQLPDWTRLQDDMHAVTHPPLAASRRRLPFAPHARPSRAAPPPAAAASNAAPPAEVAAAPAPAAATGLSIPSAIVSPVALSYDAVSRRFVLADESSDALKVIDELAGNVVDLVNPRWAAPYRPMALAIDARRGDLWVAGVDGTGDGGGPRSTLYKLQLVSGRLLQNVELPETLGPARITDIAIGRTSIYLLDATGRRVLSVSPDGGTPRVYMPTYGLGTPVSFTLAEDAALYVVYAGGMARLDLATRTSQPIPAAGKIDLTDIVSIAWDPQGLHVIQKAADRGLVAARIRLDRNGRTAVSRQEIGPAGAPAGAIVNGLFCYVAPGPEGPVLRKVPVK